MTKQPRKLLDRVCAHCARNDGIIGPRPHGSALRMVGEVMVYACSRACADKLGWP